MRDRRIFYTLDAIRGVLAILVMSRHLRDFIAPLTFQETYLAVDIFFLLSGIVLCQAYEDRLKSGTELTAAGFFMLRLIRIWPLYMLGSLIGFCQFVWQGGDIAALAQGIFYLGLGSAFVPNPGLFQPDLYPLNTPAWSLLLELLANGLYGVFLLQLNNRRTMVIVVGSALWLLALAVLAPRHNLDVGWTIQGLPFAVYRVVFSFFAGVLLYRRFAGRPARVIDGWRGNLIGAAIALAIGAILVFGRPGPGLQPYFDIAAVTLVFPALVYLSLHCRMTGGFAGLARFLGVTSFAVYAIHAPLGALILLLDTRLGLHLVEALAPWGGFGLALAILGIAFLLDRVYDRPVRQAALRWLRIRSGTTVEGVDTGNPATDGAKPAVTSA